MTDDDVASYAPTAARLVCAVHDEDRNETPAMLAKLTLPDCWALIVLLAQSLPADVTLGMRDLPDTADAVWTPAQMLAAHRIYEAGRENSAVIGEVIFQRNRTYLFDTEVAS
jgi:hypothetical protein